jgi:class 3 adenylate cyclase/tetratricopeptide (TPR) repeat protein
MQTCPNCGEQNAEQAKFCQNCGTPLASKVEEAVVPTEARKTVSLVFCDLTGSTALGEKMDPESLRRVITRYFNEMKQVLVRHGGTVEKFIGDAVMAAFGVPTVHEDDALRATRAAVEMQQAMEDMNLDLELEWGVGIKARIGVNTGEVIADDHTQGHGFVSGDAVNVAARLEQAAPPGEILIGEPTYRLVRDAVEVEEVEPLELKGKAERVPAYRVTGVIPHALGVSRRLDSPLVGREHELELIKGAYDRAKAEGSCQLVTLFGPAGSGKSRVTAEFIHRLEEDVRVLQGRCLPYGEGITYWPIAEAIKNMCGITETDSRAKASEKIAEFLPEGEESELVKERISAAIGLSDATPDTQETFWAVRKLLEELGRRGMLFVILDDIHWAETTMLDLIEYLAGFAQGVPMLILCLSRKDLLDTRPTWGTDSTTMFLDPLGPDDVNKLIDNLVGEAQLPDSVRKRIIEAAEGNPLYVEEILRMLIDDRILEKEGDQWVPTRDLADFAIPPTIHALVAARLDKLGANEQAVTQRASVIGKTFWWGAVSELSPESLRARVGHYLQTLSRKELVMPDASTFAGEDAFRFAHIMIRDAAYQAMSKELRGELHEKFAEWLTGRAGDRLMEYEEILAYHLEQAFKLREELGKSDEKTAELGAQAVEKLASAGNRAFARADMPAAANLLGRAVKLLPIRDPQRTVLSLTYSDALIEIGELKEAGSVIEQVQKVAKVTKDVGAEARAALQDCLLRSFTDVEGWKEHTRSEAERLIPIFEDQEDHFSLARTHFLLAQAYWDEYQMGAAEKSLNEALEHAHQGESKSHDESKILGALTAILLWGPAPAEKAVEICEGIIEESGGNRFVQATSQLRTAVLLAMRERFDEARELVAVARGILEDLGQTFPLARSTQESGLIEIFAGDYAAAEAELRRGYKALDEMGEKAFLSSTAVLLARALYERGETEEAERFTVASEEAAGDDPSLKAEWGPVRALCLARSGSLEDAETLAREALEFASEPDDVLIRAYALESLGSILIEAGRKDDARPVLEESLELYERKGVIPLVERGKSLLESI